MSLAFQQALNAIGQFLKWWVVVSPWEQGIRVRAGKYVKVLNAGVHLRLPIIDTAYVQTTRRRFSAVPTQTLTMADGKTVTVAGSIGYTIRDVAKLYDTLHHAEATLEAEAQGIVSEYLIEREYAELSASALKAHVDEHLDFEKYGLADTEFILTTMVCVKTYRFLQGEPRDYTMGEILDTQQHTGESTP